MQRFTRWMTVVVGLVVVVPEVAQAENFVLYLHGRGDQQWSRSVANVPGWTNVTLSYDGNARLTNQTVSTRIESAFTRYCSGLNACIVTCHSAGCMRTLKAVDGLTAAGVVLNVLWVEAAGSAAGGTALAELTTNYFGAEPIDQDLRRDKARAGTGWAHIQDAMTSSAMYHVAGRRDTCAVFVCGNWFLPPGTCDGLVCMDSAGGASKTGSFVDGCQMPMYPGRIYDQNQADCRGADANHNGIAYQALKAVTSRLSQ